MTIIKSTTPASPPPPYLLTSSKYFKPLSKFYQIFTPPHPPFFKFNSGLASQSDDLSCADHVTVMWYLDKALAEGL